MNKILLLAALLPGVAFAQDTLDGFDARGLHLVPGDGDLKDPLVTWRPEIQRAMSGSVGLTFEYAKAPLVLYTNDRGTITETPLLDNLAALDLGGAFAPHERVGITLAVPVILTSRGSDGTSGPALGDIRLAVPVGIVLPDEVEGGFGLSVIPTLDLPTGARQRFLGNRSVGAGGVLAAGYGMRQWEIDANVGIKLANAVEYENITGGASLMAGLAGSILITDFMALRAEWNLRPALKASEIPNTQSPSELVLSARGRYDMGLSWTLGGAAGLTGGYGGAIYRIYAGVGYTWGKAPLGDLPVDLLIRVVDPTGAAIRGATVTAAGQELSTDSGGKAMVVDLVVGSTHDVHASHAGYKPADGIAEISKDDNELMLTLDPLPAVLTVRATASTGEPLNASVRLTGPKEMHPQPLGDDGEEPFEVKPGAWRVLVSADGYGTAREEVSISAGEQKTVEVVLEPARVQVTKAEVKILEKVYFDLDKDTVKAESMPLLREVANTLLNHPEIELVEVAGHTDIQGSNKYNLDLSQRRVNTVRKHLIAAGVAADRLVAKGYGESQLVATGTTEADHAANRRVQFKILREAE